MKLPLQPPIEPMLALLARDFPEGEGWIYEPKWDGFRALVFWDDDELYIQSRDCKPLARYFPELVEGLSRALPAGSVLDGEIVIQGDNGLDFEALLLRIHPAASRISKLAQETPASFVAFDLLAENGQSLMDTPFGERRERLAKFSPQAPLFLTPATRDVATARTWFERFEGAGLDGVIAKKAELGYKPGERLMVKIKHQRTAEVVVGGFRWAKDLEGQAVGSLLLGLYSADGVFQHVGFSSSFKAAERRALVELFEPYRTGIENEESIARGEAQPTFGEGRTPGSPSRWSAGKDLSWNPMRPELVCEVAFDHMQGDRFRHGAKFLRWRPDKPPAECTYAQLRVAVPYELKEIFAK